MKLPKLLVPVLLGALAATGAAAQPPAAMPATPRAGDVFQIQANYQTSCPFFGGETSVMGRVIRVTAVEGCLCLPGLPGPWTFFVYQGPLPAGAYTVELWIEGRENGERCREPVRLLEVPLTIAVDGEPGILSFDPFPLTSRDPVHLTLRSSCPAQASYLPPELADRTLTLVQRYNTAIAAPCLEDPVEVAAFDLEPLAAGIYTVRHFTVEVSLTGEGELPEEPDFEVRLPVAEVPRLLLQGGRFAVDALWSDRFGGSGPGQPVPLTADSGYFWFFSQDNVELVVKVLDACTVNRRFWVFAAGLTDVEVELTVTDTETDQVRRWENPQGMPFAPILATDAFDVCPSPR